MAMQTDLLFTTDLDKGVEITKLHPLLFSGDEETHRFIVTVTNEDLSGLGVYGYFIRADEAMVTVEGSVDSEGRAVLLLSKPCYSFPGRYQLVIRVHKGDVKRTVFCAEGYMKHTTSDSIVDEENVIPSIEDLLAQIEVMEQATAAANEAAKRANEAAENAGNAGGGTSGPVTWNQVTGKPSAFTPVAHSHTQSDVSGLTEALAGKADAKHTHDYPVKSVNGMTGDVVIQAGGGGTDERIPQPTESDAGMPLRVENGEYKVGKLQKNAVEGLITDLIMYGDALSALEQTALTEDDKADIVNDTLSALAGADTSDAAIAELKGRVDTLGRKTTNMGEDVASLQGEFNELEASFIEMMVRVVCRIIQLERHLELQPPQNDDLDTTTELDGVYDNMFGQG